MIGPRSTIKKEDLMLQHMKEKVPTYFCPYTVVYLFYPHKGWILLASALIVQLKLHPVQDLGCLFEKAL